MRLQTALIVILMHKNWTQSLAASTKTLIKQSVLLFCLYELLMSSWSSRKRPPSIVLSFGHVRERIVVSDQLLLRQLVWIPEVVAYKSFDYITIFAKYWYNSRNGWYKNVTRTTLNIATFFVFVFKEMAARLPWISGEETHKFLQKAGNKNC